jgi:hypothetical protein
MAGVLTSEVEATLTPSNVISRFCKLKDFPQETSYIFSPLSYFVTRDTSVSPESLTDNNLTIFVTLGVKMLTLNLSTTVILVLAKTNASDLRNLIVRSNSKAAAMIAYSVVTEPRNKLSGIRIPSEAHNFSVKVQFNGYWGSFTRVRLPECDVHLSTLSSARIICTAIALRPQYAFMV